MSAREIVKLIAIAGLVLYAVFVCTRAIAALMEFFTRNE